MDLIVRNTMKYRLHNLKYVVQFSSSSTGSEITQDDGYVKVGDLMPGESTSASFSQRNVLLLGKFAFLAIWVMQNA